MRHRGCIKAPIDERHELQKGRTRNKRETPLIPTDQFQRYTVTQNLLRSTRRKRQAVTMTVSRPYWLVENNDYTETILAQRSI